jgi:hypothetical protein
MVFKMRKQLAKSMIERIGLDNDQIRTTEHDRMMLKWCDKARLYDLVVNKLHLVSSAIGKMDSVFEFEIDFNNKKWIDRLKSYGILSTDEKGFDYLEDYWQNDDKFKQLFGYDTEISNKETINVDISVNNYGDEIKLENKDILSKLTISKREHLFDFDMDLNDVEYECIIDTEKPVLTGNGFLIGYLDIYSEIDISHSKTSQRYLDEHKDVLQEKYEEQKREYFDFISYNNEVHCNGRHERVIIELKPKIFNIGQLLRQMKSYKEICKGNIVVNDYIIITEQVVDPDLVTFFRDQGFLLYSENNEKILDVMRNKE